MRRYHSLLGPLLMLSALGSGGCSKEEPRTAPNKASFNFEDEAPVAKRDTVLALTPFSESTHELWAGMRGEIIGELNMKTVELSPELNVEALEAQLKLTQPNCVVLIGNRAARLYSKLQDKGIKTPPSVVLMASFAEQTVAQLKSSTGIAYEVPGVTSFVTLRRLFDRKVERVGVIHRPSLKSFVERQRELATMEKVTLVAEPIEGVPTPRKIRLALSRLLDSEDVDALWVLNDNPLLSPSNIRGAWLPELQTSNIPVLVGVDSLINTQMKFGTVAVVPDHGALGVQAANKIFDLWDEAWVVRDKSTELPLSVQTVVDMKQADRLDLLPEAKGSIDRTIL